MGALARFRRLLAILGYLAECGSVPVKELALKFSMSEREAIAEIELLACIGVPPYSPDCLVEVFVDEGVVNANLPKELARPRRLTAEEALAVLVAAKGLRDSYSESHEGVMSRVVSKLETALGVEGRVDIAVGTPPFLPLVKSTSESAQALEICYYSASKDEVTRRVIWPSEPFFVEGAWYTRAWCEQDRDWRSFRVDRVLSAVKVAGRRRPEGVLPGVPGSAAVHPQDAYLQGGTVRVTKASRGEFRRTEPFPGLGEETTVVLMWVRSDRMDWVVDRLAGVEVMNNEASLQDIGQPLARTAPIGRRTGPGELPPTLGERPTGPGESRQQGSSREGSTLIRFRIGGQATLERILLVLGPEAQIVAPDDLKAVAARAAARMLNAYR
jgi:predicted DNA-binding transcriptional regulator YafY